MKTIWTGCGLVVALALLALTSPPASAINSSCIMGARVIKTRWPATRVPVVSTQGNVTLEATYPMSGTVAPGYGDMYGPYQWVVGTTVTISLSCL